MAEEKPEIWYRYEETHYAAMADPETGDARGYGSTEVRLREYTVVKRTPKGVWLSLWGGSIKDRFVLLDGRKRFACPTVEEARASFLARKRKEIRIYKARIDRVERALRAFEDLERRSVAA